MNVFNEELEYQMNELFSGLNVTSAEQEAMQKHWNDSQYSRMHIVNAWRYKGVLQVKYDDGSVVQY